MILHVGFSAGIECLDGRRIQIKGLIATRGFDKRQVKPLLSFQKRLMIGLAKVW